MDRRALYPLEVSKIRNAAGCSTCEVGSLRAGPERQSATAWRQGSSGTGPQAGANGRLHAKCETSSPSQPGLLGFTLIELLVVIAILGLLAALFLAALHWAKMKAHQAVCLSNQRQVNLSYRLHLDDAGGFERFEAERWLLRECGRKGLTWICPAAPFTTNSGLLDVHPPDAIGRQAWEHLGTVDSAWSTFGPFCGWRGVLGLLEPWELRAGSYGFNGWLLLRRTSPPNRYYLTEGDLSHLSATPVLADAVEELMLPEADDPPPQRFDWAGLGWEMGSVAIPRHGSRPRPLPKEWPLDKPLPGAVNVSFSDGHGELVKLDRLWQLYWHKDYQPPAKRPGPP